MEEKQRELTWEEEEEGATAEMWKYVFGFTEIAVVRCAIDLGIAEAIENHGSPMTLLELSTALSCDPSHLYRIMRVLVHRKIFKEKPTQSGSNGYAQTPLSRRLLKSAENSMVDLLLMGSNPVMMAPYLRLSTQVQRNTSDAVFDEVHGSDLWNYGAENPDHGKAFNDSMACDARLAVPAALESCPEAFKGIETIVDAGGGNGTTARLLVEACPWITKGIIFDLPHVVSTVPECDRIEKIGGDFFKCIPKADAVVMMWILHDWTDEECISILKNCREAIPNDKGKVIIIDAVVEDNEKDYNKLTRVKLMLDIAMMNGTKGKERTAKEWEYVIQEAGFSRHTITPTRTVQSVIQVFP
ncbi:hypothetical protein TB2_034603 [Malus domestica]|uniref:Uncharacterized protein n=1 Tax=Malus domestica TaxID=3750 RepID=A0A498JV88_MALDO|nr:hypothetical protein DVH24_010049 [Malus domestica]